MPMNIADQRQRRLHERQRREPRQQQEPHRRHAHRVERVDLGAHAHRAELGGDRRAGAPGRDRSRSSSAPNSRTIDRPIMSATNRPAPNRWSSTTPWNASVVPSKKPSRPTMPPPRRPSPRSGETARSAGLLATRRDLQRLADDVRDERDERAAGREVLEDAAAVALDPAELHHGLGRRRALGRQELERGLVRLVEVREVERLAAARHHPRRERDHREPSGVHAAGLGEVDDDGLRRRAGARARGAGRSWLAVGITSRRAPRPSPCASCDRHA